MLSIHKSINRAIAVSIALGAFVIGCAAKPAQFEDVAQREQGRPTTTETVSNGGQSGPQHQTVAEQSSTKRSNADTAGKDTDRIQPAPETSRSAVTMVYSPIYKPAAPIAVLIDGRGNVRRQWPVSTLYRPSGNTITGPTYWPSVDDDLLRPDWVNIWMDPGEFIFNFFVLPCRMIEIPPWKEVDYSPVNKPLGEAVEPSGIKQLEYEHPTPKPEKTRSGVIK